VQPDSGRPDDRPEAPADGVDLQLKRALEYVHEQLGVAHRAAA
jgi:hypothetical protein